MSLDDFVKQYNGVRNAHFIMWGALLTELAQEKGSEGAEWLRVLRERSVKELDAAKMQDPALEYSADTAEIAEIARSVIGATFDFAEGRRKKVEKS